jgi:rhomboid protease GluP
MKKYYSATNILIALNIILMAVVVAANFINYNTLELKPQTLVDFGGIIPNKSSIFTVISAMFLHGGLLHISLNMLSLKTLGNEMENFLGKQYLIIYFVSGIAAGLAIYFFSNNLTIGASGAICGLLGAKLVKTFKYHPSKLERGMIVSDIALLVGIGFMPQVSAMGHSVGLITGMALGLVMFKMKEAKSPVKIENLKDNDLSFICEQYIAWRKSRLEYQL